MGRPVPMPTREQIVHRHEAGESLRTIAADVERSPATVRRRYRDHGWEGLAPNYAACGLKGPQCSARIYRGAVWLKRAHPKWGARLIRMLLAEKWPQAYMPHERTLQRWFRQAGLQRRRGQQPHRYHGRGEAPHGVWAIDAKENIRLASGARVSWLIIRDEQGHQLKRHPTREINRETIVNLALAKRRRG
jgi:hypothetical protein